MRLICLLRAINVGGRNKIKMAELRTSLESAGLTDVATYIQSGNIAFDTELPPADAAALVVKTIEADFDLTISVLVRTVDEVRQVLANEPFGEPAETSDNKAALYVSFCDAAPAKAQVSNFDRERFGDDRLEVVGREVFVRYPQGASASKLTNAELEKRLDVTATMRNWKTANKLAEL